MKKCGYDASDPDIVPAPTSPFQNFSYQNGFTGNSGAWLEAMGVAGIAAGFMVSGLVVSGLVGFGGGVGSGGIVVSGFGGFGRVVSGLVGTVSVTVTIAATWGACAMTGVA